MAWWIKGQSSVGAALTKLRANTKGPEEVASASKAWRVASTAKAN
jgi:hypothetical protein